MKYETDLMFLAEHPTSQYLWYVLTTHLTDDERYEEAGYFSANWDIIGGCVQGTMTAVRTVCVDARKITPLAAAIVDRLVQLVQLKRIRASRSIPALPERKP